MAFDFHVQQNNAGSATALTEAHNNYVQQLHAANGMIDQYYRETLPQLLQVSLLNCAGYKSKEDNVLKAFPFVRNAMTSTMT